MKDIFDDIEINDYISKYPLETQSIVAWKLIKMGIRYINKNTRTYHPLTLRELDIMINNLAVPRPIIQSLMPQKKYTYKRGDSNHSQSSSQGFFNQQSIDDENYRKPQSVNSQQRREKDLFHRIFNQLLINKQKQRKDKAPSKNDISNRESKTNSSGDLVSYKGNSYDTNEDEYIKTHKRSNHSHLEERKQVNDNRNKKDKKQRTSLAIQSNNQPKPINFTSQSFELSKKKNNAPLSNLNSNNTQEHCHCQHNSERITENEEEEEEEKEYNPFINKSKYYDYNESNYHTSSTEPNSALFCNSFRQSNSSSNQGNSFTGSRYHINRRHYWN